MRVILLILIGLSSLIYADFSRNSNGVIRDSITHLEWQDNYSDNRGVIKKTIWQKAIDYCEELNLDSKTDWRLPNINELSSLLEYKHSPAINSIFQNISSDSWDYYWSSTSYSNNINNAWIVGFSDAYVNSDKKDNSNHNNYVRCVRNYNPQPNL